MIDISAYQIVSHLETNNINWNVSEGLKIKIKMI
jgi:hypothetical protein